MAGVAARNKLLTDHSAGDSTAAWLFDKEALAAELCGEVMALEQLEQRAVSEEARPIPRPEPLWCPLRWQHAGLILIADQV